MSQSLCFNDFTFSPIIRDNQPWFRSSELARALRYSDDRKVSRLYDRNSDEFTPEMTQLVEIVDVPEMGTTGSLLTKTRIFSLRGCHLLAMFARTPVAKAFRRWVLDVIEKYGERVPVEQPAFIPTPSTPADRKPLRSLVNAWAQIANVHQSTLWPQVRAHFQLERIDDLPVEWLPDALAWVQGKIDEVNRKPLEMKRTALPEALLIDERPLINLAEEFRQWHQECRLQLRRMHARYHGVGMPVLMEAMKRIEGGMFRESVPALSFDRMLFNQGFMMIAKVPGCYGDTLPDNENPALYLLDFARAMNVRS